MILAGDIHVGIKAYDFILKQLSYSDVIYILGNHEGYRHNLTEVRHLWCTEALYNINKEAESLNYPGRLYFLDDTFVTFRGITFIGSTLWTDFEDANEVVMNLAAAQMNDYRRISINKKNKSFTLKPTHTYYYHLKSKHFISKTLEENSNAVVITHHLPSYKSMPAGFKGSLLNSAYVSNLDEFILKHKPLLWIHGHTYTSCDYKIGETRVLCNPRGYYPNALNPKFSVDKVIII